MVNWAVARGGSQERGEVGEGGAPGKGVKAPPEEEGRGRENAPTLEECVEWNSAPRGKQMQVGWHSQYGQHKGARG